MAKDLEETDQATVLGLSSIEHAAWNLLYNMVEAGSEPPEGSWWFHEFKHLKEALVAKGLNVDPSFVSEEP